MISKELKRRITICLDKDVLKAIKEIAEKEDRALSYTANSILKREVIQNARN